MKRANSYKQNSRDWYAWRGLGLGASDAPVVMGDRSFSTRFELWAQKTGLLTKPEPNVYALKAMERGRELEPKALAWYERKTGHVVERGVNCEHPKFSFLRASLDGYVEVKNLNVEVKAPGKEDLARAKKGIVPAKYTPQVQDQMLVAGATSTDYVTYAGEGTGYFDGEDGKIISVPADLPYQQQLLTELVSFWTLIQTKTPPSVGHEDLERVMLEVAKAAEKLNRLITGLSVLKDALKVSTTVSAPPAVGEDGMYQVGGK